MSDVFNLLDKQNSELRETLASRDAEIEGLKYDLRITEGQRDNEGGVLGLVAEERDELKSRCERYKGALEKIRDMTLGITMRWPVFQTADEVLKKCEGAGHG
jgi:hypothetical protein